MLSTKRPYTANGFTIEIDLTNDAKLGEAGYANLVDRYLLPFEDSPQEAMARACCFTADDKDHAQRLYNYISNLWFMFSSPIISNAGADNKGLPIACFLGKVDDSLDGLQYHWFETTRLTIAGGGTAGDWSSIRPAGSQIKGSGGKTPGIIPLLRTYDSSMDAYHQGGTRRGAYAAYLNISHPEILDFIRIRKESGDRFQRCHGNGFHHGVNIPDSFMAKLATGEDWDLIDPSTGDVVDTIEARELWKELLLIRMETGEPYMHFSDTSNRALPQPLKDQGLRINNSNLCAEIMLPTSPNRTAVCCLSSVNVERYDEWKDDPNFVEDLLRMLDNVLQIFIDDAGTKHPNTIFGGDGEESVLKNAINSAKSERSVGLGSFGFHSYLQSKNVIFGSGEATEINLDIYKNMHDKAHAVNGKLGQERGEAPDMAGTGKRFSHMFAIAPNATSSMICGFSSPSIEPYPANVYTVPNLSGRFTNKNKHLKAVLSKYNKDNEETWLSITQNEGSIQHLEFLTEHEREVFKTFIEIDQMAVIDHAAERQPFICQGQSLNLKFPPNVNTATLNKVHLSAWKKGLKSLYYCRSEQVGKVAINSAKDTKSAVKSKVHDIVCVGCEG